MDTEPIREVRVRSRHRMSGTVQMEDGMRFSMSSLRTLFSRRYLTRRAIAICVLSLAPMFITAQSSALGSRGWNEVVDKLRDGKLTLKKLYSQRGVRFVYSAQEGKAGSCQGTLKRIPKPTLSQGKISIGVKCDGKGQGKAAGPHAKVVNVDLGAWISEYGGAVGPNRFMADEPEQLKVNVGPDTSVEFIFGRNGLSYEIQEIRFTKGERG